MCRYRLITRLLDDDRVAGGKERHQPLDQMPLGRRHALAQMAEIDLEIDLLDRPGVLDRRAIHLVEARIAHRPQREIEAGISRQAICTFCRASDGAHWQASQHFRILERAGTTASVSLACAWVACTVVFAMCVAGRERR